MLIMPSFFENVSHTPTQAALNLSGSGTSSNPYKITSTADLTNLANWVNSGNQCSGQYFELTDNIDASGVPVIGTLKNNTTYYFKGIFDGNGKSIRNLNRSNSSLIENCFNSGCNIKNGDFLNPPFQVVEN